MFGRFGFSEGVAGHITVRDPEFPDHFWVNPFGMSFRHIRQSDLLLVNHQGDVVYGTKPVNRAAFVLHAAIHSARPDVIAAAHAHSPYGKSFSSLGIPLAPLTQDACIFYNDHTLISEHGGAVVFEVEAGRDFAAAFPKGKAAIHQNHGLFTVGESVDEAAFWFISMERSCQAQLMAMAAGDPIEIRDEYASYTAQQTATRWPAGSASSRCGTRSRAPSPNCLSRRSPRPGPVTRWLDTTQPEALFILSAVAQYIGAAIAVLLFDEVEPQTVAWFRLIGATIALLVVSRRMVDRMDPPSTRRGRRVRHRHGADEHVLLPRHRPGRPGQGGDDRVHRPDHRGCGGDPVAAQRRRPRCSPSAGSSCSARARSTANALGLLFILLASTMWAVYIVVGSKVAQLDRGVAGLGIGLAIGSLVMTPVGAPWSGPVWASPSLLAACLLVGVFSNAIGYGIDQFVMRRIPIRRFSVLLALLPVTALAVGWIALDQQPSGIELLGVALVLVGVATQEREELDRQDHSRSSARSSPSRPEPMWRTT